MPIIPIPPAAGPDPGQPGHFAHHDWLTESVLALDAGLVATSVPNETISGIATGYTGFSVSASTFKVMGGIVLFNINFSRTGAVIAVPASGDVGNIGVAQFDPKLLGNGIQSIGYGGPIMSHATGRVAAYSINSTGIVSLCATAPGADITTGSLWSLVGLALCSATLPTQAQLLPAPETPVAVSAESAATGRTTKKARKS